MRLAAPLPGVGGARKSCSYYSFKDISVLKLKFGICMKLPLFSDPTTMGELTSQVPVS